MKEEIRYFEFDGNMDGVSICNRLLEILSLEFGTEKAKTIVRDIEPWTDKAWHFATRKGAEEFLSSYPGFAPNGYCLFGDHENERYLVQVVVMVN